MSLLGDILKQAIERQTAALDSHVQAVSDKAAQETEKLANPLATRLAAFGEAVAAFTEAANPQTQEPSHDN